MARTQFIDIPAGQENPYWAPLQSGDRFTFSKVIRKSSFFGRKKIAGLTTKSYLPAISVIWRTYNQTLKNAWKSAAAERSLNNWQAFVADQSQRIKFGIAGEATPSVLHQDDVGAMIIESPAEELKIVQYHPSQYWISQKVQGKRSMREPVSITEAFSLPLTISINYKSDLVSTGAGSFAKFYAIVRHSYQGINRLTELALDFSLSTGWVNLEDTLSQVLGEVQRYDLYIHLYKVRGTLLFDNPKATHSAQNWMRDPYCEDISKTFTRAFYQVPQAWAAEIIPVGSSYNSYYPE